MQRGRQPCLLFHYLVGLVAKAPTSRAKDPGFDSRLRRDFSGSSHTGDLNIATPVATLPGAWRYRVRAGTGRPGVSILFLGKTESLQCNFYLSVAARKLVGGDPVSAIRKATNKQHHRVPCLMGVHAYLCVCPSAVCSLICLSGCIFSILFNLPVLVSVSGCACVHPHVCTYTQEDLHFFPFVSES